MTTVVMNDNEEQVIGNNHNEEEGIGNNQHEKDVSETNHNDEDGNGTSLNTLATEVSVKTDGISKRRGPCFSKHFRRNKKTSGKRKSYWKIKIQSTSLDVLNETLNTLPDKTSLQKIAILAYFKRCGQFEECVLSLGEPILETQLRTRLSIHNIEELSFIKYDQAK